MRILTTIFLFGTLCCSGCFQDEENVNTTFSRLPENYSNNSSPETIKDSFLLFWSNLHNNIAAGDLKSFRSITFDSIIANQATISTDSFLHSPINQLFDASLIQKMNQKNALQYFESSVPADQLPSFVQVYTERPNVRTCSLLVKKSDDYAQGPVSVEFDFISAKQGYRIFAYKVYN